MCKIIKAVAKSNPLMAERLLQKEARRADMRNRHGNAFKGCGPRWRDVIWEDWKARTREQRSVEFEAGAMEQLAGKRVADWEAEQAKAGSLDIAPDLYRDLFCGDSGLDLNAMLDIDGSDVALVGAIIPAYGGGTVFTMGEGEEAGGNDDYRGMVAEYLAADDEAVTSDVLSFMDADPNDLCGRQVPAVFVENFTDDGEDVHTPLAAWVYPTQMWCAQQRTA